MAASFLFENDPFENFQSVFREAQKHIAKDPNAMSLATVSADGTPSVRTVLYKGMVRDGFSFYTNYESQKSKELLGSGKVAALFFWATLEQQVRIDGLVEKLTRAESEAYFKTRPRISQIGAWASHQSEKIASHAVIDAEAAVIEKKYQGQEIPCPPHWGGFHILPLKIEFWFGRQGRMHDRFVYERPSPTAPWTRYMKAP